MFAINNCYEDDTWTVVFCSYDKAVQVLSDLRCDGSRYHVTAILKMMESVTTADADLYEAVKATAMHCRSEWFTIGWRGDDDQWYGECMTPDPTGGYELRDIFDNVKPENLLEELKKHML